MDRKKRRVRAIDLFAGVGGSSCGVISAGGRVVAAVDRWSLAHDTYKSNFPKVRFLLEGCEDVDIRQLKKKVGGIDLIVASPECTSHTCAKGSAPRSEISRRTAFQVVRFARVFKPRWLVVENVVHMRSWKSYQGWLGKIKSLGYNIKEQIINASDHGVPQARRRLFVLCDRNEQPSEVRPTARRKMSAATILSKNGEHSFSALRAPKRAKATLERAERAINVVGPEKAFLLVYYGSDAAGGWQRINVPLRTLTTLDRFAYVKPTKEGYQMRMLQVPEIKCAMGFPQHYRLDHGTRREKIKLLGNAVCPPVMRAAILSLTQASPGGDHQ